MASNGQVDPEAQHGEQHGSPRPARGPGGLGIYPAMMQQSESSQPLVASAAFAHPEYWNPQLSGRTLGGFSPAMGSPEAMPSQGDLKGATYSAWDRGSDTAPPAGRREKKCDSDSISLDSLQIQDESQQYSDDAFSPGRKLTAAGYDSLGGRAQGPPADVRVSRLSWLSVWLIILSVYSTVLSGVWLGVAIAQPGWGHAITSSGGSMDLSTASLLTAIFAKTIEMSFVTVFVAFIGQVLTRRAIDANAGMTMAEMTMRTWITQPGSLIAHGQTLRYAGHTLLGILTLTATLVAMLYTTASDTMVRPKLRFSGWDDRYLEGYVRTSYANPIYVNDTCSTPISIYMDGLAAGESCLGVQYSGDSYQNLLAFMSTWRDIGYNGSTASLDMAGRPPARAMLYDNITMIGSWIETQYSRADESFEKHQRVINNVSLALPHPGVYKAATNPRNNILQPSDLDGLASYNVSASVVSPAVNVLCANMDAEELAPLVYTTWPGANVTANKAEPGQPTGWAGWGGDVPAAAEGEWLNRTAADDVFRWGPRYRRRPPVFQMYPYDNNIMSNTTVRSVNDSSPADAVYLLGKSRLMGDYTLCEMRSWPAVQCSTRFDVSGATGMSMAARCAQGGPGHADPDPDAYVHYMGPGAVGTSWDWKAMVDGWRLAMDLNGGATNNNASNARILTELALTGPRLNGTLPSMAEAVAVLVSSTLVIGSVDSPFIHYWEYNRTAWPNMTDSQVLPAPGAPAPFHARVRTQEYASWHPSPWQGVFYLVLAAAFLLNLLCLACFCRAGLVKDFLEPTNLFALATSRPARPRQHAAAMGTPQPEGEKRRRTDLAVPYRLAFKEGANDYYFEEAEDERGATGATALDVGARRKSYYRLSSRIGL